MRERENLGQRAVKILLDVVAECLQWRDVDDFRGVSEHAAHTLAHEPINTREEGGERLSRARWCRYQRVVTGDDVRPPLLLRFGRGAELCQEPFLNDRMSPRQRARFR